MDELADTAALAYAARGWPVFPCRPRKKKPATRTGCKVATTDADAVAKCWSEHPDLNIGIATGNLVVVDIDCDTSDPDPAKWLSGWDAWCELIADHGADNPTTLEVDTPSGGAHLYFDGTGWGVRNSASLIGRGVDIRGHGGYVVAPPSMTDEGVYSVADDLPVAPLPVWLAELLKPSTPIRPPPERPVTRARPGYGRAALEAEVQRARTAPEGTRNHELNRAGFSLGQLVGAGMLDFDEVAEQLVAAGVAAGLGEREAARTVASGMKSGMAQPRRVAS